MDCERCGKDVDTHPTVDVSKIDRLALCQERSMKWQRVEPGTVIPAGQPHRIEYEKPISDGSSVKSLTARERVLPYDCTIPATNPPQPDMDRRDWFIDSSWKPPLVLPTEPTWGIVRTEGGHSTVAEWYCLDETKRNLIEPTGMWQVNLPIIDFIPLTDEQVARIEAAR